MPGGQVARAFVNDDRRGEPEAVDAARDRADVVILRVARVALQVGQRDVLDAKNGPTPLQT
jgi:hypothetical protein